MKHHSLAAQKSAFTLAEVLITLGIIGIVAVIVIPQLQLEYQRHVLPIRLKETYAKLQAAHEHIYNEYGLQGGTNQKNEQTYKLYADTLGSQRRCGNNTYSGCGLLSPNNYKMLNGERAYSVPNWSGYNLFEGAYNWRFQLNNGAHIGIFIAGMGNDSTTSILWNLRHNKCYYAFLIDVNGLKGPNVLGRDVFAFKVPDGKEEAIVPYLSDTSDCTKDGAGLSCAQKIINDGWKMNY